MKNVFNLRTLALILLLGLPSCVLAQTITNYGAESGTLGTNNSFYGYRSGKNTTASGVNNTFIGTFSGQNNTNGQLQL